MTGEQTRRMDALLRVLYPAAVAALLDPEPWLPMKVIVGVAAGPGQASGYWRHPWREPHADRDAAQALAEEQALEIVRIIREVSVAEDRPPTAVVLEIA